MHINPSSDPYFRHRHQFRLQQGKRRRFLPTFLWVLLFSLGLGMALFYSYQWLNFSAFDLQALLAHFKAEQPVQDADKARLENPQDISRQALKPTSPQQAGSQKIPALSQQEASSTPAVASSLPESAQIAPPAELVTAPAPATTPTAPEAKKPTESPPASVATPPEALVSPETTDVAMPVSAPDTAPAPEVAPPVPVAETTPPAQAPTAAAENKPVTAAAPEVAAVPESEPAPALLDAAAEQDAKIKALQQKAHMLIEQRQLQDAFAAYQELLPLDPTLASPLLDTIFLAYQTQLQEHLQANELPQALQTYAAMQQEDAKHVSVNAALDAIMDYQQARMETLLDKQRLLGNNSAFNLYEEVRAFAPEHTVTQQLRAQLLKALLNKASEQVAEQKNTTPANDNAFESYQAVLMLVPGHLGAEDGLQQIAEFYAGAARTHISSDKLDSARQMVVRGEKVLPNYAAWKTLRAKIDPKSPPTNKNSDENVPDKELLAQAKAQLQADKLTRPSGDNAYETYQTLLQKKPEDARAKAGIQAVADRYAALAQAKQKAGDLRGSMALINEGLAIVSNHKGLLKLKQQVLKAY